MQGFKQWLEQWQKFPRQRVFSWEHEPGYFRKGSSFLDKEDMDDNWMPDNIYHVTTNLKKVIAAGGLKSRRELGISGLGGGFGNEDPNLISATYQYSRALEIYHEFKYVLSIVNGKIKASEIWDRFVRDNYHHPYNNGENYEDMDDEGKKVWDALMDWGVDKDVLDMDGDIGIVLDANIKTPQNAYKFFQDMEGAFLDMGGDYDQATPMNVIGFTSDFNSMKAIDFSQLAILQLAVKKDANVKHVPNELELRIDPKSVAVIRYMQPK